MPLRDPAVERLIVSAFSVPTDAPEADGTYAWRRTVLVTVEASSAGLVGIGYTYADEATAKLVETTLSRAVLGIDALSVERSYSCMLHAIRNLGRDGIAYGDFRRGRCALGPEGPSARRLDAGPPRKRS